MGQSHQPGQGRQGLLSLIPYPHVVTRLCAPGPHRSFRQQQTIRGKVDNCCLRDKEEDMGVIQEARAHRPHPQSKGKFASSLDRSPLPPIPNNDPPPATARPNYWDALGLDSDDDAEFRSEIYLARPQEIPEATEGRGLANLDDTKNISNHYFPSSRRFPTRLSAPRCQHNASPSIITSIFATTATKSLSHFGHCC